MRILPANASYAGFLPLAQLPILRLIGGDQFRKFCVISTIILVITVWITCWTQEETTRESRRVDKQCVSCDSLVDIQSHLVSGTN